MPAGSGFLDAASFVHDGYDKLDRNTELTIREPIDPHDLAVEMRVKFCRVRVWESNHNGHSDSVRLNVTEKV